MRTVSATAAATANPGTEERVGRIRRKSRSTALVMAKAQELIPIKTSAYVADKTGVCTRSAEVWLGGKRTMKAEHLALLLHTEEGIHFLAAAMEDARPAWWTALLRAGLLGGIAKRREADLRLLRQVAEADHETARGFPAALLVSDADVFRPLLEGAGAAAPGLDHRAMAPAAAGGRKRRR